MKKREKETRERKEDKWTKSRNVRGKRKKIGIKIDIKEEGRIKRKKRRKHGANRKKNERKKRRQIEETKKRERKKKK